MKKAAAILLCALFAACGWQMRGAAELPEEMAVVYIQAADPYSPFVRELRRVLDTDTTRVTRDPDEATAMVRVLRTRSGRQTLSVNFAGRPQEYRVYYEVDFDVVGRDRVLVEAQHLAIHRDINADPDDALGSRMEAERIGEVLERDIVGLVLMRIEALAGRPRENDEEAPDVDWGEGIKPALPSGIDITP
jgi:LPS-assembly lipoprotein